MQAWNSVTNYVYHKSQGDNKQSEQEELLASEKESSQHIFVEKGITVVQPKQSRSCFALFGSNNNGVEMQEYYSPKSSTESFNVIDNDPRELEGNVQEGLQKIGEACEDLQQGAIVPSQVKPGGKKAFDKANAEHGVIQMFSGLDRMIANTKQTIEACKEIKTELQNLGEAAAADRQRAEADMQELKDKMEADRQRAATDMDELKGMMSKKDKDMDELKGMMSMLLKDRAPRREESEERKVSFTEKENRKRELGEKNQRR